MAKALLATTGYSQVVNLLRPPNPPIPRVTAIRASWHEPVGDLGVVQAHQVPQHHGVHDMRLVEPKPFHRVDQVEPRTSDHADPGRAHHFGQLQVVKVITLTRTRTLVRGAVLMPVNPGGGVEPATLDADFDC